MSKQEKIEQSKESSQILVLDDEHSIRWVLERTLSQAGYIPHLAADVLEARPLLQKHPIRLAFVDINLPGKDGLSFTREILKEFPSLLTIVMTGQSTMYNTVEAMKAGAFDYVAKPFNIDEIEELVKRALRVPLSTPETKRIKSGKKADDLLAGQSKVMRDLYKAIGRVAATDLTVLIQGESGTGKELIARSIHQHSLRSSQPFVAINCAAIPSELMESELFGHEKGAFTGATERKRGKLELASQGTLFLDEIGDMPMRLQSKLLRVLQEKQFERVGGHELITTNMRVITATHQNLEVAIEEGRFREDLYYRLNIIPLTLPPLRDRKTDIPLLVSYFLKQFNNGTGSSKTISDEAINVFVNYSWPGNVRELANFVERMVVLSIGSTITPRDLPDKVLGEVPEEKWTPLEKDSEPTGNPTQILQQSLKQSFHVGIPDEGINLKKLVEGFEKELLIEALEKTGWVKNKAATLLSLNRTTLVEKLKKLKITNPPA